MKLYELLALVLAAAASLVAMPAGAQVATGDGSQVQVGRYTTQAGAPVETLSDPLSVFAQLSYPRQTVNTVGEAMAHTLVRTGFRMVPTEALDEPARQFLALPLPESQRRMGPHRVSDLLKTLLGPAWQLHSDPVTRQVWFTRSAAAANPPPQLPKVVISAPAGSGNEVPATGARTTASTAAAPWAASDDPFRGP